DACRTIAAVQTVELPRRLCLAFRLHQLRDCRLHPVGCLVVGNGRLDLVAGAIPLLTKTVETLEQIELAALVLVGRLPTVDVGNRWIAWSEDRALVGGREETAVEVVEPARRDQAAVDDQEAG